MSMKLIFAILSYWVVFCAAALNGGQMPSEIFDGGFSNPIGTKVAKQFVTNRHRIPSIYNPCDQKECYPGYSCKAVSNQYLLQVSVAVCVPDSVVKIADNLPCITIVLGGGQMGCKTQEEWEKIGIIQCGIRVTSNTAYHHTTKAHHHCPYDRYKPEHTFMQAYISCCPAEVTSTTAVTPYDDIDVNPDPDSNPDSPNEQDSSQKKSKKATIITVVSFAFVVVGIIFVMVGCFAYRKQQQNLPTKLDPTDGGMSFINHNSDADTYEESSFDPKKSLVMYPVADSSSRDYVVKNPLIKL